MLFHNYNKKSLLFFCQVSGALPTRPGISFAHFGFDEQLMGSIRKSEYTQPTPIQCQVSTLTITLHWPLF